VDFYDSIKMELGLVEEAIVDELVFTLSQAQQSIGNIEKHQKVKKRSKNGSHWEKREKLSFCEVSQAHVKRAFLLCRG
jgi:hypothetical protein